MGFSRNFPRRKTRHHDQVSPFILFFYYNYGPDVLFSEDEKGIIGGKSGKVSRQFKIVSTFIMAN